jgi:hypothetical protein
MSSCLQVKVVHHLSTRLAVDNFEPACAWLADRTARAA